MKTVHKYLLKDGVNTFQLKQGFRVVRSEYLLIKKAVYLWIEEPLAIGVPDCTCQFKVYKTNAPIPERYDYLATALDSFGAEAYHVYEIPAETKVKDQLVVFNTTLRKLHQNSSALLQQLTN